MLEAVGWLRWPSSCSSPWTAREAGRHLHLPALRAHGREAHCLHPGGQEPEEDGRRRPFRYVQGFWLPLGGTSEPVTAHSPPFTHPLEDHFPALGHRGYL